MIETDFTAIGKKIEKESINHLNGCGRSKNTIKEYKLKMKAFFEWLK